MSSMCHLALRYVVTELSIWAAGGVCVPTVLVLNQSLGSFKSRPLMYQISGIFAWDIE